MLNQRNYGVYEGRLVNDPVFFTAASGGETVLLKVGCRRNFKAKDADEYESDFAEFRTFIPRNVANHGVYGYLHKGDLISIQYSLRTGSSEAADGTRNYYQSCYIEGLEMKDVMANGFQKAIDSCFVMFDPCLPSGNGALRRAFNGGAFCSWGSGISGVRS